MATWDEVKNTIKMNLGKVGKVSKFKIMNEKDSFVLEYSFTDNRYQMVEIRPIEDHSGRMWIEIRSAFANPFNTSANSLLDALEMAGDSVCGGIIKEGVHYFFRHSILIDNLSTAALILPLKAILTIADDLEKIASGMDMY